MDAKMIVTEAQRANAYQRAIRNFPFEARKGPQTATQHTDTAHQTAKPATATAKPHHNKAAQHKAASQPTPEPKRPPHIKKHEFLSMLHACSNSGAVKLRDVSRIYDELTGGGTRATR
jgi:cell division septation protein DedD